MAEEALKKVAARLECGICLDQYKDPKLLSCFHVFCKECLEPLVLQEEGQSIIRCPNCRRATAVPPQGVSGLQSDFHAHHLFEIKDTLTKAKEPHKTQCEKCEKSTATGFCRDCGKFVCEKCTELHQMWKDLATHQIVTMQDIQADTATLIPPKKKVLYCPKHKDKKLKIYCESCNELICSNCTIRLHQGHQYDIVSDTFQKHKQEIADQLEPVKHHLDTVNQALHNFDARSKEIQDQRAAIQADIHKEIDQLHQALEQRRTELIGQLDQLTQHKLKSLAAQRDQVELLHTQLTSCLEYVEGSLTTGTQGEILEMKAPLLKQINRINTDFNPDTLAPEEEADILLVADSDLRHACEKFAEVVADQPAHPDKCYSTGNGLKSAKVEELTTVLVHAVDEDGKETKQPVKGLAAELVRITNATRAECQVRRAGGSKYEIQYQPATRGQHQLHIRINGKNIKGSPYTVMVAMSSPKSLVRSIGNLQGPWGIAVNSKGHIIVAECNGDCASVFTPEGQKIRSFGSKGSAHGQFSSPRGVAVDRDDNIIVTDQCNYRIQKFTSEGKFLKIVGTCGSGPLQLSSPFGVGINNTNNKIYIVENGNHRIQILNMDLTFSSSFGTNGSGDGQFSYPMDVAFDSTGNVYVADQCNNRVQVFTLEGNFLRKFGSKGSGDGQLSYPRSITIDRNDTVYVADGKNNRISMFTTHGQFLGSFGSKGTAEGQLQSPSGVAIDKDGFILVSENGNNRIQIF